MLTSFKLREFRMTVTNFDKAIRTASCQHSAVLTVLISFLMFAILPVAAAQQEAVGTESREAGNRELVLTFYRVIFDDHKVAEAFEKYATPNYIQHSPLAQDLPSTIRFLQSYLDGTPGHTWELKRVLADGDLVALHIYSQSGPDDPGRAIVDIFRVENERVVEHWEVIQPVVKMEGRSMF